MMDPNTLPVRKSTRLEGYDYSSAGAYFITICTQDRKPVLSRISPPQENIPPHMELMPSGIIAKKQLLALEERFSHLKVGEYIIMPDHIHAILVLSNTSDNHTSPAALHEIVCVFKSLTSRICRQNYGIEKLFQRSFMEHIIRDKEDYEIRKRYIYENPVRWYYKHTLRL